MLFDFFYIASELKKIPRKGWHDKVGITHPESVADHSYGTAIMAMVFSDNAGNLDTERIIKMALLHDLAESITGDFIPGEIQRENKKIVENQAMDEILSKLPPSLLDKYRLLWNEYIDCTSKESILLHEIDRLEMAMQAAKYSGEGFQKEKLKEFVESARREIQSKELLEILDEISYK
ncbi:MAG: HD domain-containing protein [Thaumarchaeota archaeon]|nr:HD domain-containing protein [Nitrososphaerota archaeon]MDE1872402.1 HD domain-containing protein [Nitrososphaerota archaeon]